MKSQIIGTGSFVPSNIVRNEDLTQFPASTLPLIAQKTGVLERRHASPDETTSDLAREACSQCLHSADCSPDDIDGIILATSSPDQPMPATAAILQAKLRCHGAFAFDLDAVCTGAIFAIAVADSMLRAGYANRLLVVAAELYSRILNPRDFSTYPYFGDGAGALLMERTDRPTFPWIRDCVLNTDGRGSDLIKIAAGGSKLRVSAADLKQTYFQMNGKAVFDFATERGPEVIGDLCQRCNLEKDELDKVFLHQANINIITSIAAATAIPIEKFPVNLDRYGNTAAASTLIAYDEAYRERGVGTRRGHNLIVAFGGGLTWGGLVVAPP